MQTDSPPGVVEPTDSTPDVVAREEGGVRIVESLRPAWAEGEGWLIEPEPELSIGVETGDEAYQFDQPSGALRLADGSIVVADPGKAEIFVFDAAGRFLRRAGGRGQGPGEFGGFGIMWLWLGVGGRLVVDDVPNGRVNIFEPSGEFVGEILIEPTPDGLRANMAGVFGDGSWLAVARDDDARPAGDPGYVIRGGLRYLRYRDGVPVTEIARVDSPGRYVHERDGAIQYPFIPLTRFPLEAGAAGHLYVMGGPRPEVEVFRAEGSTVARYSWRPNEMRRVADVYDRWREEELAGISDAGQRAREAHFLSEDLPLPEFVPSYAEAISGSAATACPGKTGVNGT